MAVRPGSSCPGGERSTKDRASPSRRRIQAKCHRVFALSWTVWSQGHNRGAPWRRYIACVPQAERDRWNTRVKGGSVFNADRKGCRFRRGRWRPQRRFWQPLRAILVTSGGFWQPSPSGLPIPVPVKNCGVQYPLASSTRITFPVLSAMSSILSMRLRISPLTPPKKGPSATIRRRSRRAESAIVSASEDFGFALPG